MVCKGLCNRFHNSLVQDFALRCKVRTKAWWLKCIKPPQSGFAWLDACNRKPKAELLQAFIKSAINVVDFLVKTI